jgi:hypothetical protein
MSTSKISLEKEKGKEKLSMKERGTFSSGFARFRKRSMIPPETFWTIIARVILCHFYKFQLDLLRLR